MMIKWNSEVYVGRHNKILNQASLKYNESTAERFMNKWLSLVIKHFKYIILKQIVCIWIENDNYFPQGLIEQTKHLFQVLVSPMTINQRTFPGFCARNKYKGHGQVNTPDRYCGMWLLVPAHDTCFKTYSDKITYLQTRC